MKKLVCRLSACAGLFLSAAGAFGASTYYVAEGGDDGTTDGTNPETPYATVGTALAAATEPGDVVQIGEGTFDVTATLVLNRAVTLRGAGKDRTTLMGPAITAPKTTPPWRGVSLSHDDAVVEKVKITGFQPTNGNYEKGGAVTMTKGTVRECHITGNVSYIFGSGGIGVYMSGGQVVDCVIEDNKADVSTAGGNNVGGIGVWMTGGTVSGCLIRGNKAMPGNNNHSVTQGGNPPACGGGVYMTGGTLANCTVIDNFAKSQGGNVYVSGAKAKVENCVISGGSCERSDSAYGMDLAPASALQYVTHSIIGGAAADHAYPYGSAGLDEDYGLTQNSSFDDVGWKPSASTALACGITADRRMVKVGNPVTLKAILHNAAEAPSAVAWTLTAPDASEIRLSGAEAAFTPEQVGGYGIALSVTVGGETVTAERNGWFVSAPASLAVTTGDDIHAALAQLTDGCTLNVSGTISVTSPVKVVHDITVVGEGRDATKVSNTKTGSGEWRVFDINSPGAVVRGLTISGGFLSAWYPAGAGARIGYLGGRITECTVCNSNAGGSTYGAAGGVLLLGTDALVDHCVISNNSTKGDVCGGVLLRGGTLDNCLVVGNKGNKKDAASVNGAGVFIASTAAKVSHCTIAGNGFYTGSTSGVTGGGLYFSTQPAADQVVNTILVENTANNTTTYGGGDWAMAKSTDEYLEAAALAFVNCAFETCDAIGEGSVKLDATPFKNAAGGDYTLAEGAAVINEGVRFEPGVVDVVGRGRPSGWAGDIGACEYEEPVLAYDIASSVTNGYDLQVVTLTLTGDTSFVPPDATIVWSVDGEPIAGSGLSVQTEMDVGTHTVKVDMDDGLHVVEKKDFITLNYRPGVDFFSTVKDANAGYAVVDITTEGVGGFKPDAGAVYKWFWTNDGSGEPDATGKDLTDVRFGVGDWTVVLKVENADGQGLPLEKVHNSFVVVLEPAVQMTLSDTTGEGRTPIELTASPVGFDFSDAAEYEWRWVDLQSAVPDATGNPVVGQFRGGTWSVQLVVKNADGNGLVLTNTRPDVVTILPGADFYVSAAKGDDETGDGTKAKPYKTLDKALTQDVPVVGRRLIEISGAITQAFAENTVLTDVEIYGADRTKDALNPKPAGDNSRFVLGANAFVHDLKLSCTARNNGGCVRMTDDTAVLSNCWVVGNYFTTGGNPAGNLSAGTITHCLFTGNYNNNSDGTVLMLSGTARMRNCVFTGNYIGGSLRGNLNGVLTVSGNAEMENCVIYGNYTQASTSGDEAGYTGRYSGGIYIPSGSPLIRNCVVRNNTTSDEGEVETHTVEKDFYILAAANPRIVHCNVPDGQLPEGAVACQTGKPLFVDADNTTAANRDFRALRGSPCIDAGYGRGWRVGATDASGVSPRLCGAHVDIGAYEFDNGADSAMMILVK